eukprot:3415894-Alexandrium_andersonii.AAC.1
MGAGWGLPCVRTASGCLWADVTSSSDDEGRDRPGSAQWTSGEALQGLGWLPAEAAGGRRGRRRRWVP